MTAAPLTTLLLPPVWYGGVPLNLFCDLKGAHAMEKVVAVCQVWLRLQDSAGSQSGAGGEGAMYDIAQHTFAEHFALLLTQPPLQRWAAVQAVLVRLSAEQLPPEMRVLIAHHFRKDFHHGG